MREKMLALILFMFVCLFFFFGGGGGLFLRIVGKIAKSLK